MGSYFLSSTEDDWALLPGVLRQHLKSKWPEVRIAALQDAHSIHAFGWMLFLDGRRLDGTLTKNGNAIHLDGDVRACATFAIWLRTLLHAEHTLVFHDEGYTHDVTLNQSTSEADVVMPFIG